MLEFFISFGGIVYLILINC